MPNTKKIYFAPGPAVIPSGVMDKIQSELRDYKGMQMSVLEMSHRSKEFDTIINDCETNLRKLLAIPDNYSVLFMHGGGNGQFDAVPMNLCSELDKYSADYIVNGSWSKKAANEAKKYVKVQVQNLKSDKYDRQPAKSELENYEQATFRYYCDNETIQGVEFNYVPECGDKTPLVCDMTSNFLSRPVDVSKFGVIFASAQKNCGIAGLVIVIVRDDLIGKHMPITPAVLNYKIMKDNQSRFNTPPTFAIYAAGLCFKWILEQGGLEEMDKRSRIKADLVYDTIDNSEGFYTCPVEKQSRSRMNVVFLISDKALDAKFLEESKAENLFEIKGHRSVGGFRASLYHGITLDDVKVLVKFMNDFRSKHSSSSS